MSIPVTAQAKRYLLAGLGMAALMFGGYKVYLSLSLGVGVQTFTYTGPAFNLPDCHAKGYTTQCVQGGFNNISVTFGGIAAGYTGTLHYTDIVAWSARSDQVGVNVDSSSTFTDPRDTFVLYKGAITEWGFYAGIYPTQSLASNGPVPGGNGDNAGSSTGVGFNTTSSGSWTNSTILGPPCYKPGGVSCGNPIDIGTGNKYEQVLDYETAGQNKLSLIRYYNSMVAPDTYAVSLGANWRTNYDRYLHIINPAAIYGVAAERPDGGVITFSSNAGIYTPDSDIDMTLTVSGSTWTLTDQNDIVETYTQSGSKATLNSIKQRNKYTQALTYTGGGQIAFVSDSYNRHLTLGYSSGLLSTVSTPEFTSGLTYSYVAYTSASTNLLSTVSYNTSPTTHQTYLYENFNYPFALTGITDENGNRYATWGYDSKGRGILSQLSGAVNYTSVYYNDTTGNRVVKGPLGIVETYKFATLQGVPKVKEIDRAANSPVVAASETFAYDSNGYRNSLTDWNSNITSWVNNSRGLPTQISFVSNTSNKQITNITYDFWYPHLKHTVQANALNEGFTYSSSGNLLTDTLTDKSSQSVPYTTNGQTRTTTYTYNGTGQVLTVQLPRTDVTAKTTYAYTGGTLTSITDALSHVWNIKTATAGGRPKKVLDPNSVLTTYAYKTVREWPTSSVISTSAGTLTTTLRYDSAGNLTRTTLPDSSYLDYTYDGARRITTVLNRLNQTQGITYDSAGNVTQSVWKDASSVTKRQHTATYDALGEKLTDVGGQSQSTAFTYDKNGNVLTITDPLSHVTTQTFDQLNRLSTHKDAATDLSSIKYDSHSRPLSITDPKSNVTSYVYNGFGDTIQQTSPDTLTTTYFYDPDSNLIGKNETGINFSSASYDALDRILTRTYPADATLNVAFSYDQASHGKSTGRLTSVVDAAGSLSQSFEDRGLLTSSIRTMSSGTYTTGYTYESAGRYSSITYASAGWVIGYGRDNMGQITSVTATQPGHTAVNLATSVAHLPFGPLSALTWGNGVTDVRTFDLDYRMTSITDHGASNIQYLSYGYDADNNVHTITDNVTPANNQTITWDVLDRMKSVTGAFAVSSITYDSNSNRLTYGPGTSYTVPSGSDLMSLAGTSAIGYTSTGNISSIGANTTFAYSKANRMASATVSGTTSTYTYDAFGQRLKVKVGGGTAVPFSYDQARHLLSEINSGTETDYAYIDDMPLSAIQPTAATISALHTDLIGTVQRATDSTKTINWTGNYQPFGAVSPTTTITMNQRYPGMYKDATGFNHNDFRDYIQSYGRHPEADSIDKRIAPFGNLYVYANNNPLKYTDRLGLLPEPLEIAAGAALGGYIGYNTQAGKGLGRELKGLAVGAGAGIVASFVTPALSEAAANGAARALALSPAPATAVGALTFMGTNATIAGGSTAGLNYWTGEPYLSNDVGYSALVAGFAPLFSFEALGIGGGLVLDTSTGARVALSVNTGVFGTIGTLADRAQRDNIVGAAHPALSAACQVSNP
jgi:RHS repeat-associated protein